MLAMNVRQAQGGFFDRKAVVDAVDKAERKILSRQGAYVRSIAKNSMKRKKGPAPEGSPPNAHEGKIKKFLYFAYDAKARKMVVGPAKLGNSSACKTLEHGGTVDVEGFYDRTGRWVPLRILPADIRLRIRKSGRVTTRKATVAARPFMAPALKKAKPRLAEMCRGEVHR